MNPKTQQIKAIDREQTGSRASSRIPGFYRLPVERRLAHLASSYRLTEKELSDLRDGRSLRIEHAVNMVENAIGVHGVPLGLALNFLVDGRDYIVPMAIEEASIIAAASKAALMIRKGGGFRSDVDEPIMIGQVQVLDLEQPEVAADELLARKDEVIEQANLANPRMVARGGGVRDIETRIVDGGPDVGAMLIVHLLIDVREAMGANMINYACEAAGPVIEKITGGRVNLRILSNLADRRIARSHFSISFDHIATEEMDGATVAQRMVEASRFAEEDPYRATTHNKGIFNGIGAAAAALGQDWRAIEAGGHAWAARDGLYRSLTRYWIEDDALHGTIALPMQVGAVGGAVQSHPGVQVLREISGAETSEEIAALFASVGLAQNFAACLALATVGIQRGHMALHARSVAISVGVPPELVDDVAREMIATGDVKVAVAEQVYSRIRQEHELAGESSSDSLPARGFAPGKVILFGEHATVYNYPGITAAIDIGMKLTISRDEDGPRLLRPEFRQAFEVPESERDARIFARAMNEALALYGLEREPIAIGVESDLVPGMGLGSSASFSAALISALRAYRGEASELTLAGDLFDHVQRLEAIFHGHPSGMDAATVLSEGVVWFRKGPPREIVPVHMAREMSGLVCIVEPGARTIDMVQSVRASRDLNRRRVDSILEEIGQITADATISLGTGNGEELGRLMFRNHELLGRLGVSTPGLDGAVEQLLEAGALGAKLTGSGGGGAVIALVRREQQRELAAELAEHYASVFPFTIRGRA